MPYLWIVYDKYETFCLSNSLFKKFGIFFHWHYFIANYMDYWKAGLSYFICNC